MTVIPQPNDLTEGYTATWDAWNRLVQVDDEGSLETVASYEYDGNNRRIVVDAYDSGSPSQTRHVYYSLQSQALEERVDSLADAETQFVWNLGYVDDLILRDRDTTGNSTLNQRLYALSDLRYSIVVLASTNGTIVERFDYNAYGRATVMNGSFVNRTTGSSFNWQFRYTGRRQDLDTGLMYFRARYYDASTGEFISRDPLGYVDGMSQYRAYFVPGAMDPSGEAITKDQCRAAVRAAEKETKSKNIIDALVKNPDCKKPKIICASCKVGGNFDHGKNLIKICYDSPAITVKHVSGFVLHELVHAFDVCGGADLSAPSIKHVGKCHHAICSEIRAYTFANCNDPKSPLRRDSRGNPRTRKDCIEQGVFASARANTKCNLEFLDMFSADPNPDRRQASRDAKDRYIVERIRPLIKQCGLTNAQCQRGLPPAFPLTRPPAPPIPAQ